MLLPLRALLLGGPGSPPTQSSPIDDISVTDVQPSYTYELGSHFHGATSYSISPPTEAGWSFNTSTAQLIIDTDALGAFGPFAITAFNGTGSIASNQFTVTVAAFAAAPIFSGVIPNFSFARNVTITPVDVSEYFAGATSYAVLGTLPAGLSFNSVTGVITGTPVTGSETQALVIQGINSAGTTNSNQFSIAVLAASGVCIPKTILDIIKETCAAIGISIPSSAVSSTDLQVRQLIALLNKEGQTLAARYAWQRLTKEATFTTVSTQSQGDLDGGILPCAANLSYIVNDTIWNRSTRLPVYGPLAPRDWAYARAMTYTAPTSEYRILGNQLIFNPAPAAGNTAAFEFVTRNWLQSADASAQRDSIAADDDAPVLDWQLLSLGLEWRWKKAKGLEYAEDFNTYELRVQDAIARDGTKPVLNLNGNINERFGIQPLVFAASGNWMQ